MQYQFDLWDLRRDLLLCSWKEHIWYRWRFFGYDIQEVRIGIQESLLLKRIDWKLERLGFFGFLRLGSIIGRHILRILGRIK
jgi:hypothetical protein